MQTPQPGHPRSADLPAGFQLVTVTPGGTRWGGADRGDTPPVSRRERHESLVDGWRPRRASWDTPQLQGFPEALRWKVNRWNVALWLRYLEDSRRDLDRFGERGPLDRHPLFLLYLDLCTFVLHYGDADDHPGREEEYYAAAVAYLSPGREEWGRLDDDPEAGDE
jgi:hypothetical protein